MQKESATNADYINKRPKASRYALFIRRTRDDADASEARPEDCEPSAQRDSHGQGDRKGDKTPRSERRGGLTTRLAVYGEGQTDFPELASAASTGRSYA